MAKWMKKFSWKPSPVAWIAGALILFGLILSRINELSLILIAMGTFGPGILREVGWLKDQDEFQRRAAWRAGYHAFLSGGFITFLLVAILQAGNRDFGDPENMILTILAILYFIWFFSSLLAYWGPQKTVSRTLIIFGSFWLIFIILSHLNHIPSLLMESLSVLPFFLLVLLAKKWPSIVGTLLLLYSGFIFYLFRLYRLFGDRPFERGRGVVTIIFLGPLLASGITLLSSKPTEKEHEESSFDGEI